MDNKHIQSGCEWEDNEIEFVQLQHDHKNRWYLNGYYKNGGNVVSTKISKAVAQILLANGVSYEG